MDHHNERREDTGWVDHLSQAKAGIKVFPDKLYVICVVSNPKRYRSRYRLYEAFEKYMSDSGVELLTVEVAFGNRDFEVTSYTNPWNLQLRTNDELWHKENALNLGIEKLHQLAPRWKYVAWIDADVTFARPDWAQETLHQLQHFKVVQMFSGCIDLTDTYEIAPEIRGAGEKLPGFMYQWGQTLRWGSLEEIYRQSQLDLNKLVKKYGDGIIYDYVYGYFTKTKNGLKFSHGHPGYAWAARREALDDLGGLLDFSICGANDHHMARAFIGDVKSSVNPKCNPEFIEMLKIWEQRARTHIGHAVGHVPGMLFHHWHGPKTNRRYFDRWKILVDSQYNPITDIKRDTQGLYKFVGNKPDLIVDIRQYFSQRSEDVPYIP